MDKEWIRKRLGMDEKWIMHGSGKDQERIRKRSGMDQEWIRNGLFLNHGLHDLH